MTQDERASSETEQHDEAETTSVPPSLWHEMDGQVVFIQLREGIEYLGVTHPGEPVVHAEVEGPDGTRQRVFLPASEAAARGIQGEPLRAPIMQGKLRIKQDRFGTMLLMEFADPLGQSGPGERPRSMVKAMFPPDYVGFMSAVEQNLIR